MSLILATGSNLGNKEENLANAKKELSLSLNIIGQSKIYKSKAVDYLDQPSFLNQVLEFERPSIEPKKLMEKLLLIESQLGRERKIKSGPRIIDIDILFLGLEKVNQLNLTIPHPKLFERSFVLLPLKEVPFYKTLKKHFKFPSNIQNDAMPIE